MTHTVLKDGKVVSGVMCIERSIQSCIILQASLDEVDKLLAIAQSQNVPLVHIVMPKGEDAAELERKGWTLTDLVVLTHA